MVTLTIYHDKYKIVPNVLNGITWETEMYYSTGELKFQVYIDKSTLLSEGDIVTLHKDDKPVFYGRIFSMELQSGMIAEITAYDNLRYFRNKDSCNYLNMKASDIIKQLVISANLPLGGIEETTCTLPCIAELDSTLFGIAERALAEEYKGSGNDYILFCDYDKISLRRTENMNVPIILSDSNISSFNLSTSINSCYNKVKLSYIDNENNIEGKYVKSDDEKIKEWGILQYHERVGTEVNPMIQAEKLLEKLSEKSIALTIEKTAGDIRVRGGSRLYIDNMSGETSKTFTACVKSVKHTFNSNAHYMSMELIFGVDYEYENI